MLGLPRWRCGPEHSASRGPMWNYRLQSVACQTLARDGRLIPTVRNTVIFALDRFWTRRHARLVAIRQNIAANRRRAELVRWQERRERLLAISPRSEAEHQARMQALALLDAAWPAQAGERRAGNLGGNW